MKQQRPRTVRDTYRKGSRTGSVRHAKKRAALHRQIKDTRALHHKIVLHPLSVMALLATGVLIVGWTLGVAADSYNVTAKVPAPPLTDGAIITDPTDGFITPTSPITVTGTCPDNSYVDLTRNGAFSGTAVCVSNAFSIQTSLSIGTNTILAQDYNITDDPGPTTTGITITYSPPAPPAAPPAASSTPPAQNTPASATNTSQPLLIASDYHFQAFKPGSMFSWTLHIDGGTAPYAIHTDWGDKQVSEQTVLSPQNITIEHTYAKPGYYPIVIRLTDAKNTATILQLAALIKQPGASGMFGAVSSGSGAPSSSFIQTLLDAKHWLWVAWPAYITLALMAISFWLGERQELRRLLAGQHPRSMPRPHHR